MHLLSRLNGLCFFFFNDTATTEIYTLSLHDALPICAGSSTTLTATPAGGTAPYTYSWSPGGATGSSITVSPGSTTTYTVTVTDAHGCTGSGGGTVTVNAKPTVSVNSATICAGSSATLTATPAGGTTPYTYLWS